MSKSTADKDKSYKTRFPDSLQQQEASFPKKGEDNWKEVMQS